MKHNTLCNQYEQEELSMDIFSKITSFQCSWVKRLYNDSFNAWKVTALFLIKKYQGKNFVFHSNLSIKQKVVKKFPKFYLEILTRWGKYLSSLPKVLSAVASQFIWYNKCIKIDNDTIYNCNIGDLIINEHHLIKKHQIYYLEKLNSRELYNMQLTLNVEKSTAQTYFEKKFQNPELECKAIYTLPKRVTINATLRIFQYKLLHNILYLNEMLYGKKVSPLCSFCMEELESPIHLFHSCTKTNLLWTQLQHSFQNVLTIQLLHRAPSLDLLITK